MMMAVQHQSQCIWQKEMAPSPPFFLCGVQNTVYWVLSLLTFSHFMDVAVAQNSNVMPVNMLRWMESGFVIEHIFGYKK
jgi:hypothetical protein